MERTMSFPLKNKRALITGASSGFGRAIAETFAECGANLILWARRFDRLEPLRDELTKKFEVDVMIAAVDVRDVRSVDSALRTLDPSSTSIDILVNNAGLAAGREMLHEAALEDIDAMIDTNVKGLLYVSRAVLPRMIQQGSGHLVNIGSIAGHETYSGGATYCASKFAVRAINDSLKQELLGTGIRVTSIDPGLAETEFSLVRFKGDEAKAKAVYAGVTPLSPEDVAEAVRWSVCRPHHVNIQEMVILATDQAGARLVHRKAQN